MIKKAPKVRLKEIKIKHRKQRVIANKYEEWVSANFPILENYPGRYELGERFRKIGLIDKMGVY